MTKIYRFTFRKFHRHCFVINLKFSTNEFPWHIFIATQRHQLQRKGCFLVKIWLHLESVMDQTKRPLLIPPEFGTYAEKHGLFDLYKVWTWIIKTRSNNNKLTSHQIFIYAWCDEVSFILRFKIEMPILLYAMIIKL